MQLGRCCFPASSTKVGAGLRDGHVRCQTEASYDLLEDNNLQKKIQLTTTSNIFVTTSLNHLLNDFDIISLWMMYSRAMLGKCTFRRSF